MQGNAIGAAARIAGRSFQSFSQATGSVLETLAREFPQSVLIVSQLDYAEGEYRVLDARGDARAGLEAGLTLPLDAAPCFHMATDAASRLCNDISADPIYGSLELFSTRDVSAYVGAPLELSDGSRVGALAALSLSPDAYDTEDLELLSVAARMLGYEWERVRREREVRRLSGLLRQQDVSDPLTGLADRQRFSASLDREWQLTQRGGVSSYLVVLTVEGLVATNERFGSAMGDLLIKDVARALSAVTRGTDVVGRVTGSQFGVVLVDCNGEEGAAAFCGRLRAALDRVTSERPAPVEISFGVQSLGDAPSAPTVLELAEQNARQAPMPAP
jgi:diguanylate cyclase (GGDEF)-like protein